MCQTLKVSTSGFYAWRERPPCKRQQANIALTARIKEAHAMAESFFASLEWELIDRRIWKTHAQARAEIFTWIEGWYNPRRRHSSLGQTSPINFGRKHQTLQVQ